MSESDIAFVESEYLVDSNEDKLAVEYDEVDSNSYTFRLDFFEGPLDLLLELIKKSKLSIQEVKISEITEQYLSHIKDVSSEDLERASEFIIMAAWLLEIKSKALLPRPEEESFEEESSEKLLKQKLEEYKLYKEASIKLRNIETVDILFRSPDAKFIEEPRFVLKDMNKESLMDALKKMFLKLEMRAAAVMERQIELDRFTVDEKMHQIEDILEIRESFCFMELFANDYSKSEVITTFQALLELMKMEKLCAVQDEIFGEIVINRVNSIKKIDN